MDPRASLNNDGVKKKSSFCRRRRRPVSNPGRPAAIQAPCLVSYLAIKFLVFVIVFNKKMH